MDLFDRKEVLCTESEEEKKHFCEKLAARSIPFRVRITFEASSLFYRVFVAPEDSARAISLK